MTTAAFVDTETTGLDPDRHEIWEVALILHDPPDVDGKGLVDREHVWQLPVDLTVADPAALQISEFYGRRWRELPYAPSMDDSGYDDVILGHGDLAVPRVFMSDWAEQFATLTAGCVLVGANPAFDDRRLDALLRTHGAAPAWHYRTVCVEALAVGYLRGLWSVNVSVNLSKDITPASRLANQSRRDYREHTARTAPVDGKVEYGEIPVPWSHRSLNAALGIRNNGVHTALGDARTARDVWVKIMEDAA